VHQLDIKVVNIIDARRNHEVYFSAYIHLSISATNFLCMEKTLAADTNGHLGYGI